MASYGDVSTAETESVIRRVTVAGITGAIGLSLIEALHGAGFHVRALTRSTISAIPLPTTVEVIEVDYTHSEQLEAALLGQEVVISALGDTASAVAAQEALIHAALAVGVKRFFPSEFGSDTMNPRVRSFPFFAEKVRHQDLLVEAANDNQGFSYSIVITGPFLDWGLSVVPFIINVGTESAEVYDGGSVPFSSTRVSTLARAIVACLQPANFPKTANRTLYIHDAVITQNQLINTENSLFDTSESFERKDMDTVILEEQAWTDYNNPTADPLAWIFPFINLSIWSREELCVFDGRTDNEMLGITELKGAELEEVLRAEIVTARRALCAVPGSHDDEAVARIVDTSAAEKAYEEGKRRLEGFVRPRSKSQVERVVG